MRSELTASIRAFAFQALSLAIGFGSGAALARGLGPDGRGDYQLVALVFGLAAPLLSFGLPTHWMAEARDRGPRPKQLVSGLLASWSLGVLLMASIPLPVPVLLLLALLLIGPLASPYTETMLYRAGLGDQVQALRVLDVSSSGLCIIALWAVGALNLLSATISLFATTVILRAILLVILVRRSPMPARATWPFPWRMRSTVQAWSWDAMVALSAFVDMLTGAWLLSREALGLYAVAAAIGRLSGAAFSATAPLVVGAAASAQSDRGVFTRFSSLPIAMSLIALGVFLITGDNLVALVYGEPFRQIAPAATVLIVGATASGVAAHLEAASLGGAGRKNSPVPRLAAGLTVVTVAGALHQTQGATPLMLASAVLMGNLVTVALTLMRLRRRGDYE